MHGNLIGLHGGHRNLEAHMEGTDISVPGFRCTNRRAAFLAFNLQKQNGSGQAPGQASGRASGGILHLTSTDQRRRNVHGYPHRRRPLENLYTMLIGRSTTQISMPNTQQSSEAALSANGSPSWHELPCLACYA